MIQASPVFFFWLTDDFCLFLFPNFAEDQEENEDEEQADTVAIVTSTLFCFLIG